MIPWRTTLVAAGDLLLVGCVAFLVRQYRRYA